MLILPRQGHIHVCIAAFQPLDLLSSIQALVIYNYLHQPPPPQKKNNQNRRTFVKGGNCGKTNAGKIASIPHLEV